MSLFQNMCKNQKEETNLIEEEPRQSREYKQLLQGGQLCAWVLGKEVEMDGVE